MIQPGYWEQFSPADENTLLWLSQRIKGLPPTMVRVVPSAAAQTAMDAAAEQQLSYLDLLTEDILREDKLYFVSRETLELLDAKFEISMPITGKTTKNRDFKMQGFLMGQGRFYFIYNNDIGDFAFKASGQEYEIQGGLVSSEILGWGDAKISGLKAKAIFDFTEIRRMTKASKAKSGRYKINVETGDFGTRNGGELYPITRK